MFSLPFPRAAYHARLVFVLVVAASTLTAVFAADPSDKMPDAAQIDAFIAKQEKAMERSRRQLLRKIEAQTKAIRGSRMDSDHVRIALENIAQDREAFVKSGRLPSSDELIGPVVNCVEQYQSISERVEKARAHWADRAIHLDDPAAMAKLEALEHRLEAITVGREMFKSGSYWAGRRVSSNASYQLGLHVEDLTGNNFHGRLTQTGNFGRPDEMLVVGELRGNRIAFQTTEMVRGKNRQLNFQGYLLSDRIVANMQGISTEGKPVTGSISLWNNGKTK